MSDALQIAQAYFDAWNQHDADGIMATFAEGGTYSDPIAPGLSGPAIGGYASGLWAAFPDLSFEIAGQVLAGDGLVAVQWIMRGTNNGPFQGLPPSGKVVEIIGADFITVEGSKIRSVQGYFDAGEVPRQLGLQVIVQPHAVGPFRFGNSISVQSGKKGKPGAFSITVLNIRSEEEIEQVRNFSRQIATEMLGMPEFIGWTGVTIGDRMLTVTAWEDTESPGKMARTGTHAEAMKKFFGPEIAYAGYTSVWKPERYNMTWVRCGQCGQMVDHDKSNGQCGCGQPLPEPPPYW